MPDTLIAAVEFAGYISIVKFGIFIALLFAWIWLVGWVNDDAIHLFFDQDIDVRLFLGKIIIRITEDDAVTMFTCGILHPPTDLSKVWVGAIGDDQTNGAGLLHA